MKFKLFLEFIQFDKVKDENKNWWILMHISQNNKKNTIADF